MTWQHAIIGYAAIGVLAFIVIAAAHYFSTSGTREASIHDVLEELRRAQNECNDPDRPVWKRRIEYALEKIVAPALAILLVVAAWPLAIWWKAREIWFSQGTEPTMEKEFAVEREHLLEPQDLDALETREVVTDPLGAVPGLPFGHLNRAWLNFKAGREPGDSIWTFSARWKLKWGGEEIREGYAIVRLDGIGPYFLTMRRVLKDD